jgi:hypothetical protein
VFIKFCVCVCARACMCVCARARLCMCKMVKFTQRADGVVSFIVGKPAVETYEMLEIPHGNDSIARNRRNSSFRICFLSSDS